MKFKIRRKRKSICRSKGVYYIKTEEKIASPPSEGFVLDKRDMRENFLSLGEERGSSLLRIILALRERVIDPLMAIIIYMLIN